jgi:hypothetical protein
MSYLGARCRISPTIHHGAALSPAEIAQCRGMSPADCLTDSCPPPLRSSPDAYGKPLPVELGDAGQWYDRAQKAGLRTAPASAISQVPPGSIAVWNDGKFGHVDVVIRNDGSALHVSEANWGRVPQAASKFERDNAITSSFNHHEERSLSYAAAATRSKSYKLAGFILPE